MDDAYSGDDDDDDNAKDGRPYRCFLIVIIRFFDRVGVFWLSHGCYDSVKLKMSKMVDVGGQVAMACVRPSLQAGTRLLPCVSDMAPVLF